MKPGTLRGIVLGILVGAVLIAIGLLGASEP